MVAILFVDITFFAGINPIEIKVIFIILYAEVPGRLSISPISLLKPCATRNIYI